MRARFNVGASVMLITIMMMCWIYYSKNEKRMKVVGTSNIGSGAETICTEKRIIE